MKVYRSVQNISVFGDNTHSYENTLKEKSGEGVEK